MKLRSKNKISASFNMSSMTDIVFLLLIFFMLTSTLVSSNVLDLLLPSSKSQAIEKQVTSIEIKDLTNNEVLYHVNGNEIELKNIEDKLLSIFKKQNDKSIVLYVDESVAVNHVVKILEIGSRNKFKIVLATDPS
tara:strand:- start:62 stop:466 length:405 start_codon:yes stop_codon:yes gene_type:complete